VRAIVVNAKASAAIVPRKDWADEAGRGSYLLHRLNQSLLIYQHLHQARGNGVMPDWYLKGSRHPGKLHCRGIEDGGAARGTTSQR
jgi:hypothetical protein